jgi:hypothetical protein
VYFVNSYNAAAGLRPFMAHLRAAVWRINHFPFHPPIMSLPVLSLPSGPLTFWSEFYPLLKRVTLHGLASIEDLQAVVEAAIKCTSIKTKFWARAGSPFNSLHTRMQVPDSCSVYRYSCKKSSNQLGSRSTLRSVSTLFSISKAARPVNVRPRPTSPAG